VLPPPLLLGWLRKQREVWETLLLLLLMLPLLLRWVACPWGWAVWG
jgi:hypothetical protein